MTDHPQQYIAVLGASVDEELVPLLTFLIEAGCATVASCQNAETGWGYILFADGRSLERAVVLLSDLCEKGGELTLRGRVVGATQYWVEGPQGPYTTPILNPAETLWKFEVDSSYELRHRQPLRPEGGMNWVLRFPHQDLKAVNTLLPENQL